MICRNAIVIAVFALAACQSRPVAQQSPPSASSSEKPVDPASSSSPREDATAPPPTASADDADDADVGKRPPCVPETPKPKIAAKRRPRQLPGTEKTTPVETQPPRLGSSTPEVKAIDASVESILGRKVLGAEGEDLGRIVDVQADASGRVRLVIIEFGGFLGVGNRRAAIDWGLLQFHPDDPERPVTLKVGAKQLQETPEYRLASHPLGLMAPAVPAPAQPAGVAPPPQNK